MIPKLQSSNIKKFRDTSPKTPSPTSSPQDSPMDYFLASEIACQESFKTFSSHISELLEKFVSSEDATYFSGLKASLNIEDMDEIQSHLFDEVKFAIEGCLSALEDAQNLTKYEKLFEKIDEIVEKFSFSRRTPSKSSSTDTDVDHDDEIANFMKIQVTDSNLLNKNNHELSLHPAWARHHILVVIPQCRVLIIGEGSHEENSVWDVLAERGYARMLFDKKIRTIFLEHLYDEHISNIQENPNNVIEHLNKHTFFRLNRQHSSPAEKMVNFLRECLKLGIRLISLDEKEIYEHNRALSRRIPLLNSRVVAAVNSNASLIDEDHKALVYIGAAHTNHHNGKQKIFGIAQIIERSTEVIIAYDESDLKLSSIANGRVIRILRS